MEGMLVSDVTGRETLISCILVPIKQMDVVFGQRGVYMYMYVMITFTVV